MKNVIPIFLTFSIFSATLQSREIHVGTNGSDSNPGTLSAPMRTIQGAADVAQPGDVITVHEGVYRERVDPPRGGISDSIRIVYQAASGDKVVITGSEVARNWVKMQGDVWKTTIPNSFFGSFNPYSDLIHGDWFDNMGRDHHTGAVYLNGDWLTEAATFSDLVKPVGENALWFAKVDSASTTIWAQFKSVDPNDQLVEINVRRTVFYPGKTGINYITVRGFTLEDAATPWAPPTAEQIGVIGTRWSKGWIIENNVVCYSTCSGIALGKYGDQWDNTSENTAEGYVKTIERALANGWSKENIGHHIVRNNTISHCEQAGIVGSLGAVFSTVTDNVIHDIHVRKLFSGAEMAGIKFHAAVDVVIKHNHIYRTCLGLWLDWMAQGTRVTGNLLNDNDFDVLVEVDHGPFLFDNNLFLSSSSLMDRSQGGAYVHNLFAGSFDIFHFDGRQTPFLKPHSTEVAGYHDNPCGDETYYNNIFVKRCDLKNYDNAQLKMPMDGNVYLYGAKPTVQERNPIIMPDFDPSIKLIEEDKSYFLEFKFDTTWSVTREHRLVTSLVLGKAVIPDLPYEDRDGNQISISNDYSGHDRSLANPTPGPFENPGNGSVSVRVW
ncbi:MAG TPA: right-handed parallel beta-helix repeat-containing protein [Candidatus Kryptonia bacterium]